MKFLSKIRLYFFWLIATLLLLELGMWAFINTGVVLDLRDPPDLGVFQEVENVETPRVVPHPYFGYLMTPNHTVVQLAAYDMGTVTYTTNADGFADKEFPSAKADGICLIGLFGGSAAMSWGQTEEEEKIHVVLTKLLNEDESLKTDQCNKFRVLNFGMLDSFQYNATQVFLYYADLLWGAMFYGGVGECWHGTILQTPYPLKFPEIDWRMMVRGYALQQEFTVLNTALTHSIKEVASNEWKSKSHIYLAFNGIVFSRTLEKMRMINNVIYGGFELSKNIPQVIGIEFPELRKKFQKIPRMDFADKPMREFHLEVYRKALPVVYSQPLANAFAVAEFEEIKFLSMIHPMQEALPRPEHWGKENYGLAAYRAPCNEVLLKESERLKAQYGFETFNFNRKSLFLYAKKDIFTDGTHMSPEGNELVSKHIFTLIKEQWFGR